MTMPQLAEETVQVALLSCGAHSGLAAMPLSLHFGLPLAEAEALLVKGHGVIAARMPKDRACAAIPLLAALGLRLAVLPPDAAQAEALYDLSLRLTEGVDAVAVQPDLQRLGLVPDATAPDFNGPAGFAICGLPRAKAEHVILALRSLPGVHATLCPQDGAKFDLFAPKVAMRAEMAHVLKYLSDLGCSVRDHWPAFAVGLDRHVLGLVLSRFAPLGLFGVNQAFQRYHLTLTGRGQVSTEDIRNFLATRGLSTSEATRALSGGQGLRIETALPRAAARQFLSDYAQIGLQVRADLARA